MKQIRSCPFCGGEAKVSSVFGVVYVVVCDKCHATQQKRFDTEGEAIEAWNTRADGWIPVTERFPEESGRYILTCNDGHSTRVTFANWQPLLKSWHLGGRAAYWKVRAWMPLPESWKGE